MTMAAFSTEQRLSQNTVNKNSRISYQSLAEYLSKSTFVIPLPFIPLEIMRIKLETVILREFDIACGIYSEHTRKLEETFMTHVNKFDRQLMITVDKIYYDL